MKNKPNLTSRPKKKPKYALRKTPAEKASLLVKKKKSVEKTGKNKIGTLDNANLKKLERELRETKERLLLLTEAAEEGIAIHDKGFIIDANNALARIFGYELSEMIGMKAERLAAPESWKVIREHIANKYDKPYEAVGVRKDGSSFICSLFGKPYKYKGSTIRLSTFHDITERKQAEKNLKESEERYRIVVENAHEAIIITQDMKMVFANRAAAEQIGYSKETLTSGVFTSFIHPDDRRMVTNYSIKRLNGENVPSFYSFRILSQDGKVKWVELNATIIEWNKKPATLNFLNEITERKLLEEERIKVITG